MTEIKGEPIGWVTVIRFPDGSWDTEVGSMWDTPEEADAEVADPVLADPVLAAELGEGETLKACAVVPLGIDVRRFGFNG